jgi:hypothetical protein
MKSWKIIFDLTLTLPSNPITTSSTPPMTSLAFHFALGLPFATIVMGILLLGTLTWENKSWLCPWILFNYVKVASSSSTRTCKKYVANAPTLGFFF